MRFAIAYHTDNKNYLIVAELISGKEQFETWRIYPKDDFKKAVLLQSDRPLNPKKERFNWTKDGVPVDGHLAWVIHFVEWRIYFAVNPGNYGINPKDPFELP